MNRIIISPEVERLATLAVDAAFAVHAELGPGLLESAYQVCFVHELGLRGVSFQKELPIHKAQIITYLKLTHLSLGLLINFNEVLIKHGLHRILNLDKS
jgi:hypothetical protein